MAFIGSSSSSIDCSRNFIEFQNVGLELGGTTILKDVTFGVASQTIHCLIGPNGGGKTSLLRSLLGQMSHTGTIRINGACNVGYVPQFLEMDKTLPITVLDFIAVSCQRRPAFMGISKGWRSKAFEALELVGLQDKANRKIGSLSGGEKQRVLFAQALLPMPNLLILDEPMASMDEAGIRAFENIVCDLCTSGVTVFWVHHDISQVKRVAQNVTCLNRSVLFDGAVEDVLTGERLMGVYSQEPSECLVNKQENCATVHGGC
ncbi:MAG: metal ABC transporter ATP-binding protein [Halodesulfovibrio sp.]|uniref:metal ABC transporter ATP-binding protein n=1 Tax=Halodesulfovibrio sp. TaxID=1912772 RepID=UPI00359CD349